MLPNGKRKNGSRRLIHISQFILVALLLQWSAQDTIDANGGDLDFSFGNSGKVLTDFGAIDEAYCTAIQDDDKIIAAGTNSYNGGNSKIALARYLPDGNVDSTFGNNGKVATDLGGSAEAYAITVQTDGKIVVAGRIFSNGAAYYDWVIARYESDGSIDSTFGSGGMVVKDFGTFEAALALAVQDDGKILIGGYGLNKFILIRCNPDGSLDTSFGEDGKVITFDATSGVRAIAIDSRGRILAAGTYGNDFALARYKKDGRLDSTFGDGGRVTTNFSSCSRTGNRSSESILDITIQKDDRIIVAGVSSDECSVTVIDFALARYNTDGSLDMSFGVEGKVRTDFFTADDNAFGVAVQPDGKIVAGGTTLHPSIGYEFALARYNSDGSPDTDFGSEGKLSTGFGTIYDQALGMILQPDGKIVAAGKSSGNFALARFESGIPAPKIQSVIRTGKKLFVSGENFEDGAVILINEREQKTESDSNSPSTTLVGKKAGKKIKTGDRIRVQNPTGIQSPAFVFNAQ